MLNGYHILTLTHREADLAALGQAIVRSDESNDPSATLQRLKALFQWEELAYFATCNRVAYLFYSPAPAGPELTRAVLAAVRPDLPAAQVETLAAKMRLLRGADAVRHLLEVAASMDSLVVGEREIVRQLREAFERSHAWGLSGDHLRLLLRFTIETAKEIYSATGIGEKALSIVALAFSALQKTGLQPEARILLVGAGQTNALFAKFLKKYGFRNVAVFNRTLAKAEAVAAALGGRALPLDALEHYTEGFDALVVCTGATQAVVTRQLYARLLAGDAGSKVVVDLSIPNNVERRAVRDFPMQYIEIEGLREAARENLAHRERERAKADELLNAKIRLFRERWHQRQVERSLAPVVKAAQQAATRATEVFAQEFDRLDGATQELVQRMLGYVEQKCVAATMRTVKEVAANAGRHFAPADQEIKTAKSNSKPGKTSSPVNF